MAFLPDKYEVPSTSDKYMKFKPGKNQFRVLSEPIMGNEYWVEEDGKRKPIRKKMSEEIILEEVPEPDKIRHFWAMVVFDYADEKIKILEITQKSIMGSMTNLSRDDDWGDPIGGKGYDIVVTRDGEGKETRYEVSPKPKSKKLPDGVEQLYKDMKINLNALYDGLDPYGTESKNEKVDPDDLPF